LEDKQTKLITYLNHHHRVEDLLSELKNRYREQYMLYRDELRLPYQPRGHDFMLTPTQQAAWLVLQKAFDLVTSELKQRWQLAREKTKETDSEKTKSEPSGVSQSLQAVLKSQIEKFNDRVQLQMMMDDLETAIALAKDYNRRRNLYRQQLPNAIDSVPIQLNIEKAEEERDKAINEIKVIFEKLIQEGVIVAKNNV
jgi:hypothetical protein